MKRLTVEHWQNLDPLECCGQDNYCVRPSNKPGGCRNGCIVPKLYTRLAQYEDTGISPDAVPVVRCRDCTHYNGHRHCDYFDSAVLDDDFCSYGERKLEAEGEAQR